MGCLLQRATEGLEAADLIAEILACRVAHEDIFQSVVSQPLRPNDGECSRGHVRVSKCSVTVSKPIYAPPCSLVSRAAVFQICRLARCGWEKKPDTRDECTEPASSSHEGPLHACTPESDTSSCVDSLDSRPDGDIVEVEPAIALPGEPPRGPPPPVPVRTSPAGSSSSVPSASRLPLAPESPMGIGMSQQGMTMGDGDVDGHDDDDDDVALVQYGAWQPTSSTTSTSTSTSPTPADHVRDMMGAQMVQANLGDTIEVMRRFLDRQRRLRHQDRLIGEALEEILGWLRVPLSSCPFNGRSLEMEIWRTINEEAMRGSSSSSLPLVPPTRDPAFLMQPGFPTSIDEMVNAFDPAEAIRTIGDSGVVPGGPMQLHFIQPMDEMCLPAIGHPRTIDAYYFTTETKTMTSLIYLLDMYDLTLNMYKFYVLL